MTEVETHTTNFMDSISKTPLSLLARLTPSEEVLLAISTSPSVSVIRLRFSCAERIVSTDPRIVTAKAILVANNILSQDRADEVFNFNV